MRPGILKEFPLEEFLASSANYCQPPLSPMKKSHKRPLSPSGPSVLLSPTKRRILAQEGILSPESVLKSPVRGRTSTSTLFADFAASPVKRPSSAPLNFIVDAESTPIVTRRTRSVPQSVPTTDSPTHPDPSSIHYPGFSVHRDNAAQLVDVVHGNECCEEEQDDFKENLPPRKRAKKVVGTPTIKPLDFSPALPPATPSKKAALDRPLPGSPTPRRFVLTTQSAHTSPVLSQAERNERKRLLEHEVDYPDTVSDSDSETDENAQ